MKLRLPLVSASLVAFIGLALAVLPNGTRVAFAQQEEPTAPASAEEPSPTLPPPTPSPANANLAATFARDGKLDEAIGAYLAALEEASPDERLRYRFELARAYVDASNVPAAVHQLDAYLLEAPPGADVSGAQFLLADALSLERLWQEALSLYDAYIDGGGAATAYARMGRAEALARLERAGDANAEAAAVLLADLPAAERSAFILTMAQAIEETNPTDAITWYQRLGDESHAPGDSALAVWRATQLGGSLGEQFQAWEAVIRSHPETSVAQEIVDEPPPATVVVQMDNAIGLVYYHAGRDADARAAFENVLTAVPDAYSAQQRAQAQYYLAVIDERSGRYTDAIAAYGRVAEIDATSSFADDALWWKGRLEERTGRAGRAPSTYDALASEYGGRDWGREARFRLALLDYDAHRFADASAEFDQIAGSEKGVERQRALLWEGKALAAAGDNTGASAVWQELRDAAPAEYYGLRAAVLTGDAGGGLGKSSVGDQDGPDWEAVDGWLQGVAGRPSPPAPLESDSHWRVGQELLSLGMQRRANEELGLTLEAAGKDPLALYQIARGANEAGLSDLQSRAATRLLNALPKHIAEDAPEDLWRLAYPAPFADVLQDAVDETDVPDLLMLSMVRQESFFDPLAGSTSGALGLTQIVPATGESIAQDLNVGDFETQDLFRPAVSLAFGAHYLGQQLDQFDGDIYSALAAYNAGPGAALRWSRASGGDADRLYAEIEFAQTKAYVQLVSENLARYRQIYQGLGVPELPED